MATQTFEGSVGLAGNPVTVGGYVYALRTNAGVSTGNLAVGRELTGDAVLGLSSTGGYLSIAQASGTAFNLNSLVIDRDISVLGNTYFVGYRNGVPVISEAVTNLVGIGDQTIAFDSQWQNLTEVRVYARNTLDVNIGIGFAIDDIVTTDTTPPLAPTLSVGAATTTDNTPTLTGTAEIGATVTIYNGAAAIGSATAGANGTYSFTPTAALADGTYNLTAQATDASGNVGPASAAVSLRIDATAPAVPVFTVGAGATNDTTPTLTGQAEAGSLVTVYNGPVALGTTVAAADGTFSFTPTTALSQGTYGLTATARDALGNVSALSAPLPLLIDTTAPTAPTVVVPALTNVATPTITGTAEAGSTVTVYNGTTVLGTATAGADGTYSLTPATALGAGSYSLSATGTDPAGNVSVRSVAATTVIDLTAPLAPTLSAATAATAQNTPTLTGTAEVGATVTIYNGATALGSATAGANGTYSFTPAAPLPDGGYTFTAIARDAAGNLGAASAPVQLTIDTLAPTAPVFTAGGGLINDPTPTLTGTAEAGATVTILNGAAVLGTAVAGTDGVFSFTPSAALAQGSYTLTATARDGVGNVSPLSANLALTLDLTAPGAPVLDPLGPTNDTTPTLTGTAEPGATITILDGTAVLGTTVAGADGTFTFTPGAALLAGTTTLTATASDLAGNVSVPSSAIAVVIDTAAPVAPVLDPLGPTNDTTPTLTGTAEPGATVTILDGTAVLGTTVASADGSFTFTPTTALLAGTTTLTATASDPAGNVSVPSSAIAVVIDTTAPVAPVLDPLGPTNDTTPTLTGTAEPGATVTILDGTAVLGTAVAGADGTFTFTPAAALLAGTTTLTATASDLAGNVSVPSSAIAVVIDTTAPDAPVIITAAGTTDDATPTISGTAEAGAVVTLFNGGTVIGSALAGTDGSFAVTPTAPLPDGTLALTVTARDAAGNVSSPSGGLALTIDTTVPGAPVVDYLAPTNDPTPTVTGTAEIGALVTVSLAGIPLGTDTVGTDGTFSITLGAGLAEGNNTLTVSALSPGGTPSPAAPLTVVLDTSPPDAPVITAFASPTSDPTPTIAGSAEAGSVVAISADGTLLGTATADATGRFTFTPATPLPDSTVALTARAQDIAGNLSPVSGSVAVVIDTAPPGTPTIDPLPAVTNDATPTVTGTAEAGSTVTLLSGGAIIGTAMADGTGAYTVTPTAPLADGDTSLTVVARDAAGNSSGPSAAATLLIDTVAPVGPTLADLPDAVGTATPTLTGTAEPNGLVTLFNGGTVLGTVTASATGTFSFVPTSALPEGAATITATVQDAAGNVSAASGPLTVVVDTTAPAAPVITTPAGVTADGTPTITGTAEAGATVTVLNGGTALGSTVVDGAGNWSFTPTADLGDGPHVITATATDAVGNLSPSGAGITLTIDAGPPDVPILTSTGGPTNDTTPTITGTAEAGATVTISDAGSVLGTTLAGTDGTFTFTAPVALGDGIHNLTATATDAAGQTSAASQPLAITVDTAPPDMPILTSGGGATANATPVITGTGEAGAQVTLLDGTAPVGTAVVAANGTFTVTPGTALAEGAHDLTVQLTDAAGNVGAPSLPVQVVIDTQIDAAPTVTFTVATTADGTLNAAEAAATAFTIAGLDPGTAALATFTDGHATVTVSANADGNYVADLTGLTGTVTTSLQLSDTAGNTGAVTGPILALDTIAPAGTAVADTAGGPAVESFTYTVSFPEAVANVSTDDFVVTGTNGASGTVASVTGSGGVYTVTVAGVSGTGALTLGLAASSNIADAAGNLATLTPASRDVAIVTPVTPVITAFSDDTGLLGDGVTADNTPTFTGTGIAGGTVTLVFDGPSGTGSLSGGVDAQGRWTLTSPVLADGAYTVSLTTASADGSSTGSTANALRLTIDTSADTFPQVALSVDGTQDGLLTPSEAAATHFTLTGLDADAAAVVTFTDGSHAVTAQAGTNGTYTVDLSGLVGPVSSAITVTDVAGNTASGTGNTVVIRAEPAPPALVADTNLTVAHADAIAGNLLANDTGSGLHITSIRFAGGYEVAVPGQGSTQVISDHGMLTIQSDGSYQYQAIGSNNLLTGLNAHEVFTYTAVDSFGQNGQATLDIQLGGRAPQASATFNFAFTDARMEMRGEAMVLIGPDGIVHDINGIDTLSFTDGVIQNNDGNRTVDDIYYYAHNLDVWRAHVDPDQHYAQFGWHEGRDPNAYFQTKQYLTDYSDVAAAGVNPLQHFLQYGEHEGRSPSPEFSSESYLHANPDVARAGVSALVHYFEFGRAEGRSVFVGESDHAPSLVGEFDAHFYLEQNPDVAAALPPGVTPESFALQHYLTYGANEHRNPSALFDTTYYLQQNPDVAAAGLNPLLHYQEYGWHEGRNPSASFDTNAYLERYPDVAQAHVDPLAHYLQFGMHEGRIATA